MAHKMTVKMFREVPGSVESYGREVLASLDTLVGGPESWDMRRWHGVATIKGTRIKIERHEDGPELVALALSAAPKILGALAALAVAWCKVKGARRVKFQIGKHKYEGPIEGLAQFKTVVRALEKVADGGK
jgi:hypothetical protein